MLSLLKDPSPPDNEEQPVHPGTSTRGRASSTRGRVRDREHGRGRGRGRGRARKISYLNTNEETSIFVMILTMAGSEQPGNNACSIIHRDYHMAIFISYPISTRDTHISPKAVGWYGVWYENCHIIIYLSYILLSENVAYLISYAESKARPPIAPNVVI